MRNYILLDTLFPSHSLHHPGLREYDHYFLQVKVRFAGTLCVNIEIEMSKNFQGFILRAEQFLTKRRVGKAS